MSFFNNLEKSIKEKNSLLCIGIDPQDFNSKDVYDELINYGKRIIDQTKIYAACFKPNIAFYESFGIEGLKALKDTIGKTKISSALNFILANPQNCSF